MTAAAPAHFTGTLLGSSPAASEWRVRRLGPSGHLHLELRPANDQGRGHRQAVFAVAFERGHGAPPVRLRFGEHGASGASALTVQTALTGPARDDGRHHPRLPDNQALVLDAHWDAFGHLDVAMPGVEDLHFEQVPKFSALAVTVFEGAVQVETADYGPGFAQALPDAR